MPWSHRERIGGKIFLDNVGPVLYTWIEVELAGPALFFDIVKLPTPSQATWPLIASARSDPLKNCVTE